MEKERFENGWVCPRCELTRTATVDPCLGLLPGVKFACCGHGGYGYILFENGLAVYFTRLYDILNNGRRIAPLSKEYDK